MLSFWVYRSTACVDPRSTHEGLIYLQSQDHNSARGVSGFLHREDGCFVQCIEGPADQIAALRRRIQADWRHRDLRTLADGPLKQGRFRGWDMALSDRETTAFKSFQSADGRSATLPDAPVQDIIAFVDHLARIGAPFSEPSAAFRVTGRRLPERLPS